MTMLLRIHKVGQRYFPIPAYIILFCMTLYSIFMGFRGDILEWAGAIEASLPFAALMFRIQTKKNLIRTNRVPVAVATVTGCIWSAVYCLHQKHIYQIPLLISILSAAIFFIDTYGYNFINRPTQVKELAVGKPFPEMELKDYLGNIHSLKTLLKRPALILFIRGSWCPLCMAQIKEVSGTYKEFEARGIGIIIITAQKESSSEELSKLHQVNMTYLLDDELKLAGQLALVHKNGVPIGLPTTKYGTDTIFPTVIITNERAEVIYIDQTNDITIRPEPDTFLKIIDEYQINHELELKVNQRTAEIQDLLDNIGEGFFSFGSDFSVHKEKSKICDLFFGTDIKYKDPFVLFKDKNIDHSKSGMDMVFRNECEFDMIQPLLPKSVGLGELLFELKYRWLKNELTPSLSKVIVVMKDVTEERKLAIKCLAEEQLNNMIVKVAVDQEGFFQFLGDMNKTVDRLDSVLSQHAGTIDVNELFRLIHTVKGGMSIFGLNRVSLCAHRMEDDLAPTRNEKLPLTEEGRALLQTQIKDLRSTLSKQLEELSSFISPEDMKANEKFLKVSTDQISGFTKDLLSRIPKESWGEIQDMINQLKKQPLKGALKRLISLANDLGPRLEKKIQVQVTGDDIAVHYDKLENVFGALVHLVRNSVDHGLEIPQERARLGKPEVGTLRFKAVQQGHDLKLLIGDDGGGIALENIKRVALKNNLLKPEILERMSPAEIVKLIFSPGFSTKTEVTDVSGRGVGMNAVQAAVEEIHGTIHIHTEEGKGTVFEIDLPNVA